MAVRNTLKVYGTVDLYSGRFLYHFESIFNAETYIEYLERVLRSYYPKKIYLIQDNAKYHKTDELWDFLSDERKYLEVYHLPAYSPEFNAMERLWHHTRMTCTHNRYFPTQEALYSTLISTFKSIQHNPLQIMGYLKAFQEN